MCGVVTGNNTPYVTTVCFISIVYVHEIDTTETVSDNTLPRQVSTIRKRLTICYASFATCQGAFHRDQAAQEGQKQQGVRLLAEGHLWGVPGYQKVGQKVVKGLQDEVEEDHQAHRSWVEGRGVHLVFHWKVQH